MPTKIQSLTAILMLLALGLGCRSWEVRRAGGRLERGLQSALDSLVATNPGIAGVALHIEVRRHRRSWSGAAGVEDRATGRPLAPEAPVRIASNTKTFVAAAMLRLWEEGRVNLDDAIAGMLSDDSRAILVGGGYDPGAITLRHLLTHTSGLFDFGDSAEYSRLCTENPRRRWTRADQLRFAMSDGKPYGPPGKVFAYSDTGYILLGEILERRSGQPMATALRQWVGYRRLGLSSIWLESLEPVPAGVPDRAHQYEGDRDTYDDDPSYDLYGGGGLVSSVRDLALFMRALLNRQVFAHASTLDTMLSTVPGTLPGPPAYGLPQVPEESRMGVFVYEVDGLTVYAHTGYWGTLAAYVPELDLAVGLHVSQQQARSSRQALFRTVLGICREELGSPTRAATAGRPQASSLAGQKGGRAGGFAKRASTG